MKQCMVFHMVLQCRGWPTHCRVMYGAVRRITDNSNRTNGTQTYTSWIDVLQGSMGTYTWADRKEGEKQEGYSSLRGRQWEGQAESATWREEHPSTPHLSSKSVSPNTVEKASQLKTHLGPDTILKTNSISFDFFLIHFWLLHILSTTWTRKHVFMWGFVADPGFIANLFLVWLTCPSIKLEPD